MGLFDFFNSIIAMILGMILKPLTPAIDYIVGRIVVVTTTPFAAKRFSKLGMMIVDVATSEENKKDTFSRMNKLLCLLPEYLDNCDTKECLRNIGPAVLDLPGKLMADGEIIVDKTCDLMVMGIEYIQGVVENLLKTPEGIACLMRMICAYENTVEQVVGAGKASRIIASSDVNLQNVLALLFSDKTKLVIPLLLQKASDEKTRKDLCSLFNCDGEAKDAMKCLLTLMRKRDFALTVPTPSSDDKLADAIAFDKIVESKFNKLKKCVCDSKTSSDGLSCIQQLFATEITPNAFKPPV